MSARNYNGCFNFFQFLNVDAVWIILFQFGNLLGNSVFDGLFICNSRFATVGDNLSLETSGEDLAYIMSHHIFCFGTDGHPII